MGDVLVKVAESPVSGYDEVMSILPYCQYPLTLQFRRGGGSSNSNSGSNLLATSGEAVIRSTKVGV